jgi:alkylhydroperoxidase family enzyme
MMIQVAGFLFAVAAWVNDFTDDSETKAVELAERLTVIECKLGMDKCGGATGERHADR